MTKVDAIEKLTMAKDSVVAGLNKAVELLDTPGIPGVEAVGLSAAGVYLVFHGKTPDDSPLTVYFCEKHGGVFCGSLRHRGPVTAEEAATWLKDKTGGNA